MHTNEPDWTNYEWRPARWPEDLGRPAVFSTFNPSRRGFLTDSNDWGWVCDLGGAWKLCHVLAPKDQKPTKESEAEDVPKS